MECSQKMELLEDIAEKDEVYNIWKHSRQEYAEAFEAYANGQPDEIRNMLWGYAESGRMMLQRQVYLACRYMEFPRPRILKD